MGKVSLIVNQRFIFGSKFNFPIQFKILCVGYTKGFLIAQLTDLRENFSSSEKHTKVFVGQKHSSYFLEMVYLLDKITKLFIVCH